MESFHPCSGVADCEALAAFMTHLAVYDSTGTLPAELTKQLTTGTCARLHSILCNVIRDYLPPETAMNGHDERFPTSADAEGARCPFTLLLTDGAAASLAFDGAGHTFVGSDALMHTLYGFSEDISDGAAGPAPAWSVHSALKACAKSSRGMMLS